MSLCFQRESSHLPLLAVGPATLCLVAGRAVNVGWTGSPFGRVADTGGPRGWLHWTHTFCLSSKERSQAKNLAGNYLDLFVSHVPVALIIL